MNASKILTADPLDILFEGRNKDYGAYQLRKTYGKRITIAITSMIAVCVIFLISSFVLNSKKNHVGMTVGPEVILSKISTNEKPPEVKVTPPPKPIEKPQVKTIAYTTPIITKVDDVTPPPSINDITNAKISNLTHDGVIDDRIAPPVIETKSTIVTPLSKPDDDNTIFNVVQIAAKFQGGFEAWSKYLERNLNRELPIENGAPAGKYTVVVVFVVDKNGNISDVQAENDPGYGTKDEAIRIIKKSPAWEAAIQNGRKVICRHRQAITFVVEDNP